MKLIAGDIGGTTTRLICAEVHDGERRIIVEKHYQSADYSDFMQVLECFLVEYTITETIEAACFAVAGPVKSGIAAVTNLPWMISEEELKHKYKISKVKLINDFIAVVYGIAELQDDDVLLLQPGEIVKKSSTPSAVIIGAGTGLGVAHRVWLNGSYHAFSTEAGHTGFAAENEQQIQLLQWLLQQHSHVSLETILSGKGLVTIYNFLREHDNVPESITVKFAMKNNDPAQVITENALSTSDELCRKTLQCFIDIYGAAAGNAALNFYPVDEVYIAGGIAPKIKDKLLADNFKVAFSNKGLMSSNMEKITIKLIIKENSGLYGALSIAKTL